ncbi:hypothetical protein [Amantichitinum ursilacus]|uniref:Uncharacterized protein n=1 Tax=Amantichitinum ursilacus TaxID=857265 RepID=A0A0N1JT23_9NEIS|nr:hypothetical protein [Amantichitinum ursilacus]KPC53359.1 hypothetical protein WG78_09725 [Amantichitinum ursilacus]
MHTPTTTLQTCPTCGARPHVFARLLNTLRGWRNPSASEALSEEQFNEMRSLDENLNERRGQVHDRHFF